MRVLGMTMLLVVGCANAHSDPAASLPLVDDAGASAQGATEWRPPSIDTGTLELPRVCHSRASIACADGCGPGLGCCVTGARPTGTCLDASQCPWQCALDCADLGRRYGFGAAAQCESLCLFVDVELQCER